MGLARDLKASAKILSAVRKLNPGYLVTHYVEAANRIPADMHMMKSQRRMHLHRRDTHLKLNYKATLCFNLCIVNGPIPKNKDLTYNKKEELIN